MGFGLKLHSFLGRRCRIEVELRDEADIEATKRTKRRFFLFRHSSSMDSGEKLLESVREGLSGHGSFPHVGSLEAAKDFASL